MNNLKPNAQRAKIARILIWIVLAITAVALVSLILQCILLYLVENGSFVSFELVNVNEVIMSAIPNIYTIVNIVSAVTFILWFERAYRNLHQKVNYLRYEDGWAVGCWFVPIISLYYPYRIMKELYVETNGILSKQSNNPVKYNTVYVEVWWTLFIFNGILGVALQQYTKVVDEGYEYFQLMFMLMAYFSYIIILALVTIKVIRDYSKMEQVLMQLPPQTPPIENIEV